MDAIGERELVGTPEKQHQACQTASANPRGTGWDARPRPIVHDNARTDGGVSRVSER